METLKIKYAPFKVYCIVVTVYLVTFLRNYVKSKNKNGILAIETKVGELDQRQ
jgi:hypothetical protein